MDFLKLLAFRYLGMLIVCLVTIGYAISIPWAIFFVVTHIIMSVLSGYLITLIISAAIVYGILFYYGLPWWYMLLVGQNVLRFWEYRSIQEKVRAGELDVVEASQELGSSQGTADVLFYIAFIGMVYQCLFD